MENDAAAAQREIVTHRLPSGQPPYGDQLVILAGDEPGPGGANHVYNILYNRRTLPGEPGAVTGEMQQLKFQKGGIQEVGVNGITNEALIAVVMDRLEKFEAGPYPCQENSQALSHLMSAMMWLQLRTRRRMARGVEGITTK